MVPQRNRLHMVRSWVQDNTYLLNVDLSHLFNIVVCYYHQLVQFTKSTLEIHEILAHLSYHEMCSNYYHLSSEDKSVCFHLIHIENLNKGFQSI